MPRLEPESGKVKWYKSDGAKSVYASLISILIGLAVGMIVIIIVGLAKDNISMKGIWDGIRLVFLGVFSTGRVEGQLTFGFNPINLGNMLFRATPLILTGPAPPSWTPAAGRSSSWRPGRSGATMWNPAMTCPRR